MNNITPALFKRYRTPEDFACADIEEIERYIRSIGLYHSKAKYIKGACMRLVGVHDSRVPDTMEELVSLSGVARKTANIVLAHGYGKQEGIAVDTHVKRLSDRLSLSKERAPEKIERDLMALIPRKDWGLLSDLLIHHGRAVCSAKRPGCQECGIRGVCPYYQTSYNQKSR